MITTPRPQGLCDARFATVQDAFAENFEKRGDVGAAACVYVDGKAVVDLWGGFADAARTRSWVQDTIISVASSTKGMTALCAHILVDRGLLDLDAPVARYWPEFARSGKGKIPVRWLLGHRAGLPAVRRDMTTGTLFDWTAFTTALVETDPWWEPGTQHGYHARTYGYLVGEVIRRISGKTVGQFFRSEVAEPLSADFYIGVPASEDARAAEVLAPPRPASGEPTRLERARTESYVDGRSRLLQSAGGHGCDQHAGLARSGDSLIERAHDRTGPCPHLRRLGLRRRPG